MTDSEIVSEMRSESLLNRVRRLMCSQHGRLEQAEMQHSKPSIMDRLRMEFDGAQQIIDLIEEARP